MKEQDIRLLVFLNTSGFWYRMYPGERPCSVIITVTASSICPLWRHLQGLPVLTLHPKMQERCLMPTVLCCFSKVLSSFCMFDHKHDSGLHLPGHQHLNRQDSFDVVQECGIALLSLSVRCAGPLTLVTLKIYNFQSVLLEKSHAVMV